MQKRYFSDGSSHSLRDKCFWVWWNWNNLNIAVSTGLGVILRGASASSINTRPSESNSTLDSSSLAASLAPVSSCTCSIGGGAVFWVFFFQILDSACKHDESEIKLKTTNKPNRMRKKAQLHLLEGHDWSGRREPTRPCYTFPGAPLAVFSGLINFIF